MDNDSRYDGKFEYESKKIFYNINAELRNVQYDSCGEPKTASRFLHFFDGEGNTMGFYPYYDDIDKVTRIGPWAAKRTYEEMIKETGKKV